MYKFAFYYLVYLFFYAIELPTILENHVVPLHICKINIIFSILQMYEYIYFSCAISVSFDSNLLVRKL